MIGGLHLELGQAVDGQVDRPAALAVPCTPEAQAQVVELAAALRRPHVFRSKLGFMRSGTSQLQEGEVPQARVGTGAALQRAGRRRESDSLMTFSRVTVSREPRRHATVEVEAMVA